MSKVTLWLQLSLATLVFTIAWSETSTQTERDGLIRGSVWCLLAALLIFRSPLSRLQGLPFWLGGVVSSLLPLCWDIIRRRQGGEGSGPEFLMLAGLINAGFYLTAAPQVSGHRLVLLIGLAVTGFAFTLTQSGITVLLGGAFLVVALYHLFTLSHGHAVGARGEVRALRPLAVVSTAVVLLFAICCFLVTPHPASALGGWFLGSGGSKEGDPFGRGGIGEGEGEVAATQKTEDIGFADTDVVVESKRRTLFDAVNEMLGEPEPVKKLSPQHRKATFLAKEILEKPKSDLQAPRATRGFSVRRGRPKTATRFDNQAAESLLYITGRTPCHLRMTAYDRFDGEQWKEEEPFLKVEAVEPQKDFWMQIKHQVLPPVFGASELHSIKYGLLMTDRIPTLPNTTQARIDRLDKPDFYLWAYREILRLDVPQVPQGIKVQLRSRTMDYQKLVRFPLDVRPTQNLRDLSLPPATAVDPAVYALAKEWVANVPPGWQQVQTIVQRLRSHAVYDRAARPPRTAADPIRWFLLEGKRGPDYLFASAATLMLRSLGYRARLVSGFYVSGAVRDEKACHSLVRAEDIHFWVEVLTDGGAFSEKIWTVFEPTPGFTTLTPIPTWTERLLMAATGGKLLQWQSAMVLLAIASLIAVIYLRRFFLLDLLATLRWRWVAYAHPDRALLAAIHLLDRRARWAGVGRHDGMTLTRFYRGFYPAIEVTERESLGRFLQSVEQVLYAPASSDRQPALSPPDRAALVALVGFWTQKQFRFLKQTCTHSLQTGDITPPAAKERHHVSIDRALTCFIKYRPAR